MTRPTCPEAPIEPVARSNGRPPEAHNVVPLRDRLAWDLTDIAALMGVSRRLLERQRSAGKLPPPDVRIGRRCLWRPGTITRWLDEQGGNRR
ncbi:MAG: helix-turn-helix transcriptional regulator [Isosphaerales bacterium]